MVVRIFSKLNVQMLVQIPNIFMKDKESVIQFVANHFDQFFAICEIPHIFNTEIDGRPGRGYSQDD